MNKPIVLGSLVIGLLVVLSNRAQAQQPELPSKIEVVFTSPSGLTRTVRGQANAIGWFHDPRHDFAAGESGVWKAKMKLLFDGHTSAGQVTEPFPTGDVLGSRDGEFFFYVVDGDAPQLTVSANAGSTVRPADGPVRSPCHVPRTSPISS